MPDDVHDGAIDQSQLSEGAQVSLIRLGRFGQYHLCAEYEETTVCPSDTTEHSLSHGDSIISTTRRSQPDPKLRNSHEYISLVKLERSEGWHEILCQNHPDMDIQPAHTPFHKSLLSLEML